MNNFRVKHKEGIQSENLSLDIFQKRGHKVTHRPSINGKFPDYDYALRTKNGIHTTVEVKRDNKNNKRVYVEFEYRNLPSGIDVTKAEWIVIHKPSFNSFYYVSADDLRQWLHTAEINSRLYKASCEEGHTKGYLVPLSVFKLVM